MSDKRISDLTTAAALSPNAIVPVAQVDPIDGILKTFGITGDKIGAGCYAYPNTVGTDAVQLADVGKIAMNDGSGTAKVYNLSGSVPEQKGSWTITVNGTNWSGLSFGSAATGYNIVLPDGTSYGNDRNGWASSLTPPTGTLAELSLIQTSIDAHITAHSLALSTSITGDTLTIEETSFNGVSMNMYNAGAGIFTVVQRSEPALAASPTAYPLGKILGLRGTDVLISSAAVETYILDPLATVSIDQSVFNAANLATLNYNDRTVLNALAAHLVVPSADGTARTLDLSPYSIDSTFLYAMRDQLLGLVLKADSGTITVVNLNALGPILSVMFKAIWYKSN